MDITLPYKWIKEYLHTDLPASEFAGALSIGGPSIEKWHHNDLLDDELLEIEVTSNRVDMASILGIAREGSAILGLPLQYKEVDSPPSTSNEMSFSVEVKDKKSCPRYQGIVVKNVTVAESPTWLKNRLEALGMNSINLLVDISNYVLLEYGQPTHIFDYDKVKNGEIIVRKAENGESFVTLDNQEKELNESDLVIADSEKILGLAGVKGGLSCGISKDTKNIIIEAANFEPYSIRKSARGHLLLTDASSLFEKGLNAELTTPALNRVFELVIELAGGEVGANLIDVQAEAYKKKEITFDQSEIKRLLGIEIDENTVIDNLRRLGFEVDKTLGNSLKVGVPFFRHEDVETNYDIVEEIARIYGYGRIPSELPVGVIPSVQKDPLLIFEDKLKDILMGIGLTEAFTRSLVSDNHADNSGFEKTEHMELFNPLTEDYKYLRRELLTSMLTVFGANEDARDELNLFELNMTYIPRGEKELPEEVSKLVIAVNDKDQKSAYYKLKGYFEFLLERMYVSPKSVKYDSEHEHPFAKGASAEIEIGEQKIGKIGVISEDSKEAFGIKKNTAMLEVNVELLFEQTKTAAPAFSGIPKFPPVARDFAYVVDLKTSWDTVREEVENVLTNIESVSLFDVFEGKGLPEDKKSLGFRIILRSNERTLKDKDIEEARAAVEKVMMEKFSAEQR